MSGWKVQDFERQTAQVEAMLAGRRRARETRMAEAVRVCSAFTEWAEAHGDALRAGEKPPKMPCDPPTAAQWRLWKEHRGER